MNKKKIASSYSYLIIQLSNHPFISSFLLGICATLTLAPFFLFPLVIPAYGGLYYLLKHAQTKKRAAAIGFFWGWGFYMSGLYWFVIALLTDPEKFAWLIPFALFGLTAVIALYSAVFGVLFYYIRHPAAGQSSERRIYSKWPEILRLRFRFAQDDAILFAMLFTLVEYARGHLFTGFQWNLVGYAFGMSDASIQLASVVGIYGLTFFTVLLGAVWATNKRNIIAVWALFLVAIVWGVVRLQAPTEYVEGVKLRLVQANILQHHKWNPEKQMQILREHVDLTQSAGLETITHVIWPETAVPYALKKDSVLAARLGEILLPSAHLITGAVSYDGDDVFNSIVMLNHAGEQIGRYDKHKLVPFGEFLPLRWLIPDALETPVGMMDMSEGEGVVTENWQGLPPLSPLICYEAVFPELSVNKQQRPEWLLTITNDAWFGNSTGPYQHLEMARMRAVEQGLPLVRVANTGISAVYDAYGRKLAQLPLMTKGYLDVELPKPLQNRTTYARFLF